MNENIAILLLAAKFGVRVCPHAGGVGLCELVRHLAMFDLVAVSGSTEGRVIEYVDHLHEHFLDPAVLLHGHYVAPTMPGFSSQMLPPPSRVSVPRRTRMDDPGEVVTTETKAARYVGGHAIDVAPVAQQAPDVRERSGSTWPLPASVGPTCTSCTGTWISASPCQLFLVMRCPDGSPRPDRGEHVVGGRPRHGDAPRVVRHLPRLPLAGHQHICQRLIFVGIDSPGAMQSSWTVPSRILVRLPDEISLRDAGLVEPTAVAVHDVRRAQLRRVSASLWSAGGRSGCSSRWSPARPVARCWSSRSTPTDGRSSPSSASTCSTRAPTTWPGTWKHGPGAPSVPLAFEVSGSQPGLDTAIDALAVRGRLVVVAIHPQARPVSLFRLFWRELTVIGARVYERTDYERAVDLVAAGVVPADALISAVVPLSEAADAFVQLERGGGVMKVLIDCRASADA